MTSITEAFAAAEVMLNAAAEHTDGILDVTASTVTATPDSADGITIEARMQVYAPAVAATIAARLALTDHGAQTSGAGHVHHQWRGVVAGVPATVTAIELKTAADLAEPAPAGAGA